MIRSRRKPCQAESPLSFLSPSNAFPSEFYWRSCDERWMNLERQGLPLRGGIFVQGGGESLAALLRLLPFNLPFFRDLPVESSLFPDRYICRRMHSDLSCHDLSRWNFLRGLLVKIFNFNRFLRPRILLCF